MDTVFIKGLQLQTLIGVYDFERHAKQRIIVDVEMQTDLSIPGATDDVLDTIDYGKVAERLSEVAAKTSYQLLEALGTEMVNVILQEFSARKVSLTINKPDILDSAEQVGIVLTRSKLLKAK